MGILFGTLPLVTALALWLSLWSPGSSSPVRSDLRLSSIAAWLGTTVLMVVATEALSLGSALATTPVRITWIVLALASVALAGALRRRPSALAQAVARAVASDRLVTGLLAAAFVMALACAVFTPPNTYDSLTYHVARTESWLQQASVAHYATSDLRQIEFGPLNAFWFLHIGLLGQSDVFFNAVQLISLGVVLLPGVSWLAGELGASARLRGFLMVTVATTPMVILQASSTQNDLLLSGFLVATVCFAWVVLEAPTVPHGVALGLAVGASVLTKGTALVLGLPFVGWFLFHAVQGASRSASARGYVRALSTALVPVVVLTVALNAQHYGRNYAALGSIFGDSASWNRPAQLTIAGALSNIAKNLSLNVSTPIYRLNELLERGFRAAHAKLLPVDVDDPGLNFFGERFAIVNAWNDEEHAANLLQLVLLFACFGLGLARWLRGWRSPGSPVGAAKPTNGAGLGLAVVLGFVAFSGLLNWQLWGNRLLTPWFALALVWCARELSRLPLRELTVRIATVGFFVAGLPWLLQNGMRPLVGSRSVLFQPRHTQWFAAWPEQGTAYAELLDELGRRSFKTAGLHLGAERLTAPVLPLQRFFKARPEPATFFHVGVTNASGKLEDRSALPDLIVSNHKPQAPALKLNDRCYTRVWQTVTFGLYEPEPCSQQHAAALPLRR